jgi:2-polyprenyl-3-methyl-5-hydroxy-6-metoxy-1,4-benzoquinol methylase
MKNNIDLIAYYSTKKNGYYALSREELLPYLPKNLDQVLDIGCSEGNFGKLLKEKFGCKVYGVEPNENAANIAKTKLDYIFNNKFDTSLNFEGVLFDCIFFNDVLEHLEDPFKALQMAKQLLTTDGHIVASIPNLRHFNVIWDLIVKKDFKYVADGILDNTHLRFFTKKSIERLVDETGLKVEKIEGIQPQFDRKFKIINFLSFHNLEDMKYIQFVVVAKNNINSVIQI